MRNGVGMQRGYEPEWLGGTFSKAVFFGNGLMAILAGLVAQTLVGYFDFGRVAPFDAAAVVMVLGGVLVLATWSENYGDSSDRVGFASQLQNAAAAIRNGERRAILLPFVLEGGDCGDPERTVWGRLRERVGSGQDLRRPVWGRLRERGASGQDLKNGIRVFGYGVT
jgi:hypothetical protein